MMNLKDLISNILKHEEEGGDEGEEEMLKGIEETKHETMAALEKMVNMRLRTALPNNVPKQSSDSNYVKYRPSQLSAVFNSDAKERIIKMVKMPVDRLEPPKFKYKRASKASGSPPVLVMRSPPRPVTAKDQQDWKLPPWLSNWKNPKGYTIPPDMRLAVDVRLLRRFLIDDDFVKLSKAFYVKQQKTREARAMRSQVQKEMMMKEEERKDQGLQALAAKAHPGRSGMVASSAAVPMSSDRNAMDTDVRVPMRERERDMAKESEVERKKRLKRDRWLRRDKKREELCRERERERGLAAEDAVMGCRAEITIKRYRDICEKVALGMASTGAGRYGREKGMDSGFAADDQYNIYCKGLFTAQSTLSTLYRPKKDMDSDMYGGAIEQLEKIMKTERFKPDKAFAGTSEKSGPRDRPVEFEKEAEEADPFGLDQFLLEVKKGKKKATEKPYSGGTMNANAGSSVPDGNGGGSNESHIGFERGH